MQPSIRIPQAIVLTLILVAVQAFAGFAISSLELPVSPLYLSGALSLISFGLLMWLGLVWTRLPILDSIDPSQVSPRAYIASVIGALGLLVTVSAITTLISPLIPEQDLIVLENIVQSGDRLAQLIVIVFVAGIAEELFFRGLLLRGLLRSINPIVALVISSALFSILHLNWAQIPGTFLLGFGFGLLVYVTGSIIPAIVAHMANNAIALWLTRLAESLPEDIAGSEAVESVGAGELAYSILLYLALGALILRWAYMILRPEIPANPLALHRPELPQGCSDDEGGEHER